jgi:hypothetical protein
MRKINIKAEGPTGAGSEFTTESGEHIFGVKRAVVTIDPRELLSARLEIFCGFAGIAEPQFMVVDPLSGKLKRVKRIEFHDGSSFESE